MCLSVQPVSHLLTNMALAAALPHMWFCDYGVLQVACVRWVCQATGIHRVAQDFLRLGLLYRP